MLFIPGIRVAVVNVPVEPLDPYEESQVENAMANLKFKNTPYKLVGASGSSKDGRFYFVDKDHSQLIAERFRALATGSHRLLRDSRLLLQGGDRGNRMYRCWWLKTTSWERTIAVVGFGGRCFLSFNCPTTASTSSGWHLRKHKPRVPSRSWRTRRRSCSTPTLFSRKARSNRA